jgi:branched-chain amino acid aminotransferase
LTVYDLYTADEAFITATLVEIAALTMVDGHLIGEGTAGPVTRALATALRQAMVEEGIPVEVDPTFAEAG